MRMAPPAPMTHSMRPSRPTDAHFAYEDSTGVFVTGSAPGSFFGRLARSAYAIPAESRRTATASASVRSSSSVRSHGTHESVTDWP